jgi:hypothetical protein
LVARTGSITINGSINSDAVSARLHFQAAGQIIVNRSLNAAEAITFAAAGIISINLSNAEVTAPVIAVQAAGGAIFFDGVDVHTFSGSSAFANRLVVPVPVNPAPEPEPEPAPEPEVTPEPAPVVQNSSFVLSSDLVRRVATPWFVPVLPAITFTSPASRPITLVFPVSFSSFLPSPISSALDFRGRSSVASPGSPERALSFGRNGSYALFSEASAEEEDESATVGMA